ncbi:MAG: ROK family protein [Anaerolineae bacterium]
MLDHVIGVDLGGTRIRAALLDHKLHILNRVETLTKAEEGLNPTLERIKEEVRRVLPPDGKIAGIGISAPGPLNPSTGVVVHPPNLPGWQDVPLGDILKDEFKVPVYVGNDANVAALAEATRGAARGYRHVIYVTVSTGIGSGIIVDGRLLLGRIGLAAEAGHMIMLVGDRVSTLEEEAAGPDMARQAQQRIEAGERSAIVEMVRRGDLSQISGSMVGRAATMGDPLALNIIQRSGMLVGCGIVNLLHLFNPEIVVVGGGVTSVGELLFNPMREAIERYAIDDAYWRDLVIKTPELGEDVSIIGAAALVVTKGGVEDVVHVAEMLGSVI